MADEAHRPTLAFWFEFASTYSYLAAMRAEDMAAEAGVTLRWRPFLLGPIFARQGWNTSPFNLYPAKGRYMWRDMERLCRRQGLPLAKPSVFPQNGLLAARMALVADGEGWCPAFTRAVYGANFAEGRDISEPAVLISIVDALGRAGETVLAKAQSAETKARLRRQNEEAENLGIFGAPSFTVGDELFWGNDRLEQAIEWALSPGAGPA